MPSWFKLSAYINEECTFKFVLLQHCYTRRSKKSLKQLRDPCTSESITYYYIIFYNVMVLRYTDKRAG